jgi:hypothetical protein
MLQLDLVESLFDSASTPPLPMLAMLRSYGYARTFSTGGVLPKDKIRARLRKLASERQKRRSDLVQSSEQLALGADNLLRSLQLAPIHSSLTEPCLTWDDASQRDVLPAFLPGDHGLVTQVVLNPPFDELHHAARATNLGAEPLRVMAKSCANEQGSQREC